MKLPVRAEYHQHYPTHVLRDATDRIVATFDRIEDAREAEDKINGTTARETSLKCEVEDLQERIPDLEIEVSEWKEQADGG